MKRWALFGVFAVALLGLATFFATRDVGPGAATQLAEADPPPSAAPLRADGKLVLAFGDSLTAGYGLAQTDSFAAKLETSLTAGGMAARVHNGGVSGDTTAAGKARLGWVIDSLGRKPDLVILELGANDMLRGLPLAETRANLDSMMAELKRREIKAVIAGMRASPNMGPDYVNGFDALYPALARKYNAPLYPFFMEGVATQKALLISDGIHPNPKGVDVIIRGIGPIVKAALE
jgi:acyl-CoA thioesterase-1